MTGKCKYGYEVFVYLNLSVHLLMGILNYCLKLICILNIKLNHAKDFSNKGIVLME